MIWSSCQGNRVAMSWWFWQQTEIVNRTYTEATGVKKLLSKHHWSFQRKNGIEMMELTNPMRLGQGQHWFIQDFTWEHGKKIPDSEIVTKLRSDLLKARILGLAPTTVCISRWIG
jgi:hypothetical protein